MFISLLRGDVSCDIRNEASENTWVVPASV